MGPIPWADSHATALCVLGKQAGLQFVDRMTTSIPRDGNWRGSLAVRLQGRGKCGSKGGGAAPPPLIETEFPLISEMEAVPVVPSLCTTTEAAAFASSRASPSCLGGKGRGDIGHHRVAGADDINLAVDCKAGGFLNGHRASSTIPCSPAAALVCWLCGQRGRP